MKQGAELFLNPIFSFSQVRKLRFQEGTRSGVPRAALLDAAAPWHSLPCASLEAVSVASAPRFGNSPALRHSVMSEDLGMPFLGEICLDDKMRLWPRRDTCSLSWGRGRREGGRGSRWPQGERSQRKCFLECPQGELQAFVLFVGLFTSRYF